MEDDLIDYEMLKKIFFSIMYINNFLFYMAYHL